MSDAAEQQMKKERDRFVAFAFASADVLIELDQHGHIVFTDGAVRTVTGQSAEKLENTSFPLLIDEQDRANITELIANFSHIPRVEQIPVLIARADGTPLPVLLSGFRADVSDAHIYLTLSLPRLQGQESSEIFRRDLSSGLLKKESFIADASKRIREADRQGKHLSLSLFDFSSLKPMLDNLLPEKASALLTEISDYLRKHSLDGDTAGVVEENTFSVLRDDSISEESLASGLADITRKIDPAGKGIAPVIASLQADTGNLTEQDAANALLYTINKFAREHGEAFNISALSESYQEMLEETVEKIKHFRDTVDNDRFQIAFQPIVDIKTSIIHHFECLVRFDDAQVFSNPFHFISFGEQSGVIGEFDLAMLQKILDVLKETAKKGNHPRVAVNISGRSLSSSLVMDAYNKILENYERIRKQVIVEITESFKIENIEIANEFIQQLREKGNSCCLDDFGTGESSFDYLRSLQVDYIKIDGSYVRESVKTVRGRQMLRAMAGLCSSLNVTTIGEMVEDEKAARLLWECGIKFGQGYLFGKPTVDVETLMNCSKPTPFFGGFLNARRITDAQRNLWKQ